MKYNTDGTNQHSDLATQQDIPAAEYVAQISCNRAGDGRGDRPAGRDPSNIGRAIQICANLSEDARRERQAEGNWGNV